MTQNVNEIRSQSFDNLQVYPFVAKDIIVSLCKVHMLCILLGILQ